MLQKTSNQVLANCGPQLNNVTQQIQCLTHVQQHKTNKYNQDFAQIASNLFKKKTKRVIELTR